MSVNEPGVAWCEYSVPAIRLPNGSYVMDSKKIAQKLEDMKPSPSLHLDTGLHDKASAALGQAAGPLLPVFIPIIGRSIVLPSDSEWFENDRSKRFGMSMAEWEKTKGGEPAWEASKPGMAELKKVMTENKKDEGPFIMGSVPCYGDLIVLGFLKFFRVLGLWEKWLEAYNGPEMERLWEAGEKWMERGD